MDTTDKTAFENYWGNFVAQVKGKLMKAASSRTLSFPYANLILNDAAASWFSEYDVNGKWLLNYKKSNPDKAKLVYEILGDMRFGEDVPTREISPFYDYAIPTVGALCGWCISYFCGGVPVIRIISTLAPAAVLYPVARTWRRKMDETNRDKAIDKYIAQLDRYYHSVVSVLS